MTIIFAVLGASTIIGAVMHHSPALIAKELGRIANAMTDLRR
jgi:hypothetical protein